MTHERKINKKI